MWQLIQKIVIVFAILLLIFFVTVLVTAWYLGAFAPVRVLTVEQEPHFIVTLLDPDSPDRVPSQIETVGSYLARWEKQALLPVAVFYSDPFSVNTDAAEASGGWIVRDSIVVDTPFVLLNTPRQTVAAATIKIHSLIARHKIYPVLKTWIEREGYHSLRNRLVLEFYYTADSLEVQVPVTKIQYDSLPPL
jgi:hypothetical protein